MSSDDELAADLAAEAGHALVGLRSAGGDPGSLRERGDRMSHEFLTAQLRRHRPGDAVLSEEGRDDPARLTADRVWIVDPLDGTREFGEPDRADWAVHVALWEGGALRAGAVALPAQGRLLCTADPPPPPATPAPGDSGTGKPSRRLRIVVSRSRAPALASAVARCLDAELVPLGSAGAKAAEVIGGGADAYLHDGGQYEWDSAAPVAVARAAGLHTSRLDGSVLEYNQASPWLPDILICPVGISGVLLESVRVANDDLLSRRAPGG